MPKKKKLVEFQFICFSFPFFIYLFYNYMFVFLEERRKSFVIQRSEKQTKYLEIDRGDSRGGGLAYEYIQ